MLTAVFNKSVSLLLVLLSGQKEKRVAALPLKINTPSRGTLVQEYLPVFLAH